MSEQTYTFKAATANGPVLRGGNKWIAVPRWLSGRLVDGDRVRVVVSPAGVEWWMNGVRVADTGSET